MIDAVETIENEILEDTIILPLQETLLVLPYDDAFLIIANLLLGLIIGYVGIRGLLDPWKSF